MGKHSLVSGVGYISTAYGTSGGSNNWNMGLVDQTGYPSTNLINTIMH